MSGSLTFFPGFNPTTDLGMFAKGADVIVNTVNCQGTGKGSRGVAGQVFSRFPQVHDAYMQACKTSDPQRRLRPGMILPVEVNASTGEREKGGGLWILNAATKDNWREDSQFAWTEAIAQKLVTVAERTGAKRFAIPPLGCGEGGLDWKRQVGPMMRPHLEALAARGVDVFMFAEDPQPERGNAVSVRPEDNRKTGHTAEVASSRVLRPNTSFVLTDTVDWYAGIGARPVSPKQPTGTPKEVEAKMVAIGQGLAATGWGLRSGGAAGADDAFERGHRAHGSGGMQIFLPEDGFNGRSANGKEYLLTEDAALKARTETITRKMHPAGDRLSGFALRAMSRNVYQVMGPDLASHSKAVVCYTHKGEEVGGTGQALRLASLYSIPVINLGDSRWRDAPVETIVQAMDGVRQGRGLKVPSKPKRVKRDDDAR